MNACAARRRHAPGGSVLILVLWFSLGLVSLTLVFGHAMSLEFRGADNALAGRQAEQAIEGAARYACFVLAGVAEPGLWPAADTYAAEQTAVGDARFWFLGRAEDGGSSAAPVFGLIDEAGKLNLNTASGAMLAGLPGMTPELAAAILDWRDADEDVRADGAESTLYLLSTPGYMCKNERFETVEELLLLNGASWNVLYGEDANRNGVLDPNENDGDASAPADDADGVLEPGLVEYLTVWSREPNSRADGSARINVNRAPQAVAGLLRETLGEQRGNELAQRLTGQAGQSGQAAQAAPVRSVLEWYIRSGMTAEEFDRVSDAVTVSDASFVDGLVNVNTAGEAVLACLPGIGEANASTLVAHRLAVQSSSTSLAWVAEALEREAAIQAGPYLTARTYQATADAAAVGRHGRGYRRTLFVIDRSGGSPCVVYRRDMDAAGWALGLDAYEELAEAEGETPAER